LGKMIDSSRPANHVCAVMVTYNGGAIVARSTKAIVEQVDHLIIVDNCSDENTLKRIEDIQRDLNPKVTMILNEQNRGIAAALNQGVKAALSKGFEWILTLDQDS